MRAHPGRTTLARAFRHTCRTLLAGAVVLATHSAAAFTQAQATQGAQVYALQCARCHQPEGQGKAGVWKGLTAPELIGPDALPPAPRSYQQIRRQPFETAGDLFDFVSVAMPADQPASLAPDEYWNVIARLLAANGVAADGVRLDAASAARTALPHRRRSPGDEQARP